MPTKIWDLGEYLLSIYIYFVQTIYKIFLFPPGEICERGSGEGERRENDL